MESVAVLLPVAAGLACVPSAPVTRALLAGELPDEIGVLLRERLGGVLRHGRRGGPDWPCSAVERVDHVVRCVVVSPVAVAVVPLPALSVGATSNGLVASVPE